MDKVLDDLDRVIDGFERDLESHIPKQRSPGQKLRLLTVVLLIYIGLFVFVNVVVGFISEHSYVPIPPPDPTWGWFAWYQIFIFAIESFIPLGIAFALLRKGGLKVVIIAWLGFAFFFGALVDYSWSFVAGDPIFYWLNHGGDYRFWVHPFTWDAIPATGPMIWWMALTRFGAAAILFYVAYRLGKHHIRLTSTLPTYQQGGHVCYRSSLVSDVDYDICKPLKSKSG